MSPALASRFLTTSTTWETGTCPVVLAHDRLFVTPWTAACQASLSFTDSRSLLKFMSIESVMPSNHLILSGPGIEPGSPSPQADSLPSEPPKVFKPSQKACIFQLKESKISQIIAQ